MRTRSKVTIKDVARAAGFSTYTVSSVLNNKGDISQETSDKILTVARELNYGTFGTVTAAKRMTSTSIGIVLPQIECLQAGFYNRAVSSFRNAASEHDLDCKLFTEADILKRLKERPNGGISAVGCKGLLIFCPWEAHRQYLRPLLSNGIATAIIRRNYPRTPGLFQLLNDDANGMLQLLNYLYSEKKSRRMAYISPSYQHRNHPEDREATFSKFADEFLKQKNVLSLEENSQSNEEIYDQLAAFIRERPKQRPALFGWSDACAARIHSAMQARGLRSPDDFMVVGYNDDPVCLDLAPALTTIRIPIEEMVQSSCEYLASYVEDSALPPAKKARFPQTLMLRGSTGD
ncbi:LacI family DNA-binding transcriptional regulator [Cerasicoccus maritimus]|uniref:LacI family DNA-binding transcriptional regulator n=1 Tax=Cerasicoccus maritimus TaxID=490089 RepID=UPI0028526ED4|nr:LacI family DNA-binding transcriptional regulator [Cerasicoccus maritimus]